MNATNKTLVPGAGRPIGNVSALPANMCATIAQRLKEQYSASDKMGISAAITATKKTVANGKQRANFALLNYANVRKALTRLRKNQRWIEVSPGLMIHAASELSATSAGQEEGKAAMQANDMVIASGVALQNAYVAFRRGNPTEEEVFAWLVAHEARISGRKTRS
jgi:hypothetical protein